MLISGSCHVGLPYYILIDLNRPFFTASDLRQITKRKTMKTDVDIKQVKDLDRPPLTGGFLIEDK